MPLPNCRSFLLACLKCSLTKGKRAQRNPFCFLKRTFHFSIIKSSWSLFILTKCFVLNVFVFDFFFFFVRIRFKTRTFPLLTAWNCTHPVTIKTFFQHFLNPYNQTVIPCLTVTVKISGSYLSSLRSTLKFVTRTEEMCV